MIGSNSKTNIFHVKIREEESSCDFLYFDWYKSE